MRVTTLWCNLFLRHGSLENKQKMLNQSKIINTFKTKSVLMFLVVSIFLGVILFFPAPTDALTFKMKTTRFNLIGLVGHWPFDGKNMTNGVAADLSGNANNGNPTSIATSTFYTVGKIGQGVKFDGVDDFINLGLPASLETSFITLSAWTYYDKLPSSQQQFYSSCRAAGAQRIFFDILATNIYAFRLFLTSTPSTQKQIAANTATTPGWHHLVGTYDGTIMKMYVDGVLQTTTLSQTDTIVTGAVDHAIGRDNSCAVGQYMSGKLDDFRIYSRALSATEVIQLYNFGLAKFDKSSTLAVSSSLLGYWTFDGKNMTNGVAADISGNANNGNLIGIATSTFYAAGKIGQGVNFDGINDRITTGSDFIGTTAGTYTAWVYPISYGQSSVGRIIDNGKTILEATSTNNTIGFSSDGFATQATAATNALPLNKWTHVTVTRNSSGTANFYINGVLSGSADQPSGTPAGGSTNVILGNVSAGAATFNGLIDNVRVYNRVLSATEILNIYGLGK